jgi:hypothetical protein
MKINIKTDPADTSFKQALSICFNLRLMLLALKSQPIIVPALTPCVPCVQGGGGEADWEAEAAEHAARLLPHAGQEDPQQEQR